MFNADHRRTFGLFTHIISKTNNQMPSGFSSSMGMNRVEAPVGCGEQSIAAQCGPHTA
jgi:hypothetical protein